MDQHGSLTRRHMKTRLSSQLPTRLDIQPLKLATKDSAPQGVELARGCVALCGPDIALYRTSHRPLSDLTSAFCV